MDRSEAIARFSSITGADLPTAEHFLAAGDWDLNNSINFYVEAGGPQVPSAAAAAAAATDEQGTEATANHAYRPTSAQGNIPDPYGDQPWPTTQQRSHTVQEEDEDLQAALTASLRTAGDFIVPA